MVEADRPSRAGATASGRLVPCVMISKGRIMLPGEGGPAAARDPSGELVDLFEVADQLLEEYRRLYVVDLDGVERDQPELDYLQEIARGGEIWVDAGIRNADGAIDVLVAGAHRAVLSTAFLPSERELKRAWRLSSDLVVELDLRAGKVDGPAREWSGRSPEDAAAAVRELGPRELVLGFREDPVDWSIVRGCADGGPAWVSGTFREEESSKLASAGAVGGIFHIDGRIGPRPGSPIPSDAGRAR